MTEPAWDGNGRDPWLPARLDARLEASAVERDIRAAVWAALSEWLVALERLLLRSGASIDLTAMWSLEPRWRELVDLIVQGEIFKAVGLAFRKIFGPEYPVDQRPAVNRYLTEVHNRLVRVPDEVYDIVAGQVAAGANLGESIPKIRDRVDDVLSTTGSERWPNRATVIARTECLLPDSLVESDGIRAVYRRWYEGPIFRVHMASGQEFSGTAHHPVLTTTGWLGFGQLLPGHDLVCNAGGQGARTSANEHISDMPSCIGEIYDALSAIGIVVRAETGVPDFHGDGMDGYVDIATTDRELLDRLCATSGEHLGHVRFESADVGDIGLTTAGKSLSVGRHTCSAHDSQGTQSPNYGVLGHSEVLGDVPSAGTGQVSANHPFDVQVHPSGTPVSAKVELGTLGFGRVPDGDPGRPQDADYGLVVTSVSGRDSSGSVSSQVFGGNRLGVDVGPACSGDHLMVRGKRYPGLGEYGPNPAGVDAEAILQGVDTLTRPVGTDKVIRVEVISFTGHVYNLTTRRGWFNYGSLYTGNTVGALNAGRTDAFQAVAEADPDTEYERMWISTDDRRTRETHDLADGQRVPLTSPFIVGGFPLAFPGDPTGPPQEIIQCRCTSLLVEKGELVDLSNRQFRRGR